MRFAPMLFLVVGAAGCGSSQTAPKQGAATATRSVPLPASPGSSRCAPEFVPYEPRLRPTDTVRLPAVPKLETRPIKIGDAYSVWGASYHLRSHVHRNELVGKEIVIEGYVVKTNLPDAPRCAVHRTGVADSENCRAPMPAFWVGDAPDSAPAESIRVMGWASNYAQIYAAIRAYDAGKPEYVDEFWGVRLPNPLPAHGAKVRVSGVYSKTFARASSGMEVDANMGLFTYAEMSVLEPASELATLPGMRRAKPR